MKKIISIVLAAVVLLSQCNFVYAADSGVCGDNLFWEYDKGILQIYGSGEMYNYVYSGDTNLSPWHKYASGIETVIIGDGVLNVGANAFSGHENLKNVKLPDGLERIGIAAFDRCESLKAIHLPDGIKKIGSNAFQFCYSLEEITIPASVEYMSEHALANSYSLKKVAFEGDIPNGIDGSFFQAGTSSKMVVYCKPLYFDSWVLLSKYTENLIGGGDIVSNIAILTTYADISLSDDEIVLSSEKTSAKIELVCKDNIGDAAVEWLSADESVAKISSDGTVTRGERMGSTLVYAKLSFGDNFALLSCQVSNEKNGALINLLPTEGIEADFPVKADTKTTSMYTGEHCGFIPSKFVEKDTSNSDYREILAKTNEIIKGCSSDLDKAKAIGKWVSGHVKYGGTLAIGDYADQIYAVYKSAEAHCMGYTILTGLMLYMADIPNVMVTSVDHGWNMALADGRWVAIDATNKKFDFDMETYYGIRTISFGQGDCCMVISDEKGIRLSGVGPHELERESIKNVAVPEYVSIIEGTAFDYCENLETLTIPASVKEVGEDIFEDCSSLHTVYYGGSKSQWDMLGIDDGDFNVVFAEDETDSEIKVYVKGKRVSFDQPPIIVEGRTLVPVRAVFEALGASVDWGEATRTVIAKKGDTVIMLGIGSNVMYKNGAAISLDVAADIVNGRTLVPIRAVSEAFDLTVDWDENNRTITVK